MNISLIRLMLRLRHMPYFFSLIRHTPLRVCRQLIRLQLIRCHHNATLRHFRYYLRLLMLDIDADVVLRYAATQSAAAITPDSHA